MRTSTLFVFAMAFTANLVVVNISAQNTSPYWSLAGNSTASNTTSKLGTTNGINLRLYTNNVERVRILSTNGFVGVGTTAPNARLHVNTTPGTTPFRVQINATSKLLLSSNGGLSVGSATTAPANGLYVAGNAGIGTATQVPGYKLHVSGGGIKVYQEWETGESDVSYGVYAEGATGVYGSGMTGISGSGMTGVEGNGHWGVYGNGSTGVVGFSEDGIGGSFESNIGIGLEARTTSGPYAGAFYGAVYLSSGYTTSDKNLKHNIQAFEDAIGIINRLKPRQYEFKTDTKYAFLHLPKGNQYGLLAQDVEEVLPELVSTANHQITKAAERKALAKPDANGKMPVQPQSIKEKSETLSIKAVNYTELIPIMIKGMQELSEKTESIAELEKKNQQLEAQIRELRQIVLELKNGNTGTLTSISAYLEQNAPNPVNGTTSIPYHVPESTASARIVLTNAKGQIVKEMPINSKGTGRVNINTAAMPAGAYNYTLYVDGKQADSKRLIIAR